MHSRKPHNQLGPPPTTPIQFLNKSRTSGYPVRNNKMPSHPSDQNIHWLTERNRRHQVHRHAFNPRRDNKTQKPWPSPTNTGNTNNFLSPPQFIWVKAHNNITQNEEVDFLAKQVAASTEIPTRFYNSPHQYFLFKDRTIISEYPRYKKLFQSQAHTEVTTHLKRRTQNIGTDIQIEDTLQTINNGIDLDNSLDATNHKEQSFRIQLATQSLPILEQDHKWNNFAKSWPMPPLQNGHRNPITPFHMQEK